MNIYELAKQQIETQKEWSTNSVKLWEGKTRTVYAKRNSIGQIAVFITTKESIKKNAKVANIQWLIGTPGNFESSSTEYNQWVKKVQEVL